MQVSIKISGKSVTITHNYLVISSIILIALLLRSWNLTFYPMEWDESHYLMRAQNIANDPMWIWKAYSQDSYWFSGGPPFHEYLVAFFIKFFGPTEFTIKFTSAIFGSLTVLLVYFIGRICVNNKVGILAAIILAVSFFHVF